MLKLDTTTISQRAALVVAGTVESVTSDVYQGNVRSAVRMSVSDTLKGTGSGEITFYVPGGAMPNGHEMIVDGMPRFHTGDQACVFINAEGWIIGGDQGRVALRGDRVAATGQRAALYEDTVRAAAGTARTITTRPLAFGLFAPTAVQSFASAVEAPLASVVTPVINTITPGTVSAGTNATITITGTGFGATKGKVSLFYRSQQPTIDVTGTALTTWTDTQIVCKVPVAVVDGYAASPGSGPLVVTNAAGGVSTAKTLNISFGYGQYRWAKTNPADAPNTRVIYKVNPGTVSSAERGVDAAAASWNAVDANFRFVDGGTTALDPANSPKTIGWTTGVDDTYLALAYYDFNPYTGLINNCYITFNSHYSWGDASGGANTNDIQSVATHELGHWLSLRDLYGSADSGKVMYGFGTAPGSTRRTLTASEIAGILYIYGADPLTSDVTPPVTTSDALSSYIQTATIHLSASDEVGGSGLSGTYAILDGAARTKTNTLTTSVIGPHILLFWSVDAAGNVEGTHTATFSVNTEKVPPVTISDVQTSYAGSATIHLTATDNGGAGVRATYASLDNATPTVTTLVSTSAAGTHTLEYWSEDNVGNAEAHHAATFTVTPGQAQIVQSLTRPVTPSSVRHKVNFTIYGFLQPHFAAGTHVTLKFYRYQSGRWVLRKTLTVHVFDSAGVSKYSVRTSVLYTGSWRVRSYHAFPLGNSFSTYRYFKVRT